MRFINLKFINLERVLLRILGSGLRISRFTQEPGQMMLWRPVILAIGIACYFQFNLEVSLYSLIGAIAFIAFALFGWRDQLAVKLPLSILLCLFSGYFIANLKAQLVAAPVIQEKLINVDVSGHVEEIERFSKRIRLRLSGVSVNRLKESETPKYIRISLPHVHFDQEMQIGDRISIRATLTPPPEPSVPDVYDFARTAWFQQLGGLGYSLGPIEQLKSESKADFTNFQKLRDQITTKLRKVGGKEDIIGLRAALVTGDRTGIEGNVYQVIRDAGLAHLLAISGLHLGLLTVFIFGGSRLLMSLSPTLCLNYNTKKIAACLAILFAAIYMVIAGATVPTIRAFIMLSVAYFGIIADRQVISLRTVAIAALVILALYPETILSAGFQLSFAAVTCLVYIYSLNRIRQLYEYFQESIVRRIIGYILFLSLTSLVATLATAPFVLFHFGSLPTYGIIANLVAVPVMGIIVMPAVLLSLFLIPIGVEVFSIAIMDFGLEVILQTANVVTTLPYATFEYGFLIEFQVILLTLAAISFFLISGPIRYLVPSIFLLFLVFIPNSNYQEVLIDGEGRLYGYFDGVDEGYISEQSANSFIRRVWQDRWAVPEITSFDQLRFDIENSVHKSQPIRCDSVSCLFEFSEKVQILVTEKRENVLEACGRVSYIIYPKGYFPDRLCSKSNVIDMLSLRDTGGLSWRYLIDTDELSLQTVATTRLGKPWSRTQAK